MKKFTQKELEAILREHELWVTNPSHGKRADLRWADLSGVDLSGVDLRCADLQGANLSSADLRKATLYRANLFEAKLFGTNLSEANLSWANLRWADILSANLSGADLSGADLRWADLRGANLFEVKLSETNLSEANLSWANLSGTSIPMNIVCPEEGSFIGFKKVMGNYIVKLLIPDDAHRSSATSRRCRCDKATVLSITKIDGTDAGITEIPSIYKSSFAYRVGETVSVDNFDDDRWNEAAPGIHFFITRKEAVAYH